MTQSTPWPRAIWWGLALLLVPIIPFVIWGEQLEPWIEQQIAELNGWQLSLAAVFALASDILLPIPSSMVGTLLGSRLNWPIAVAVIWLGQMLGASLGFALARWLGRPVLRWLASESDCEQLEQLAHWHGPRALVITRALPILAEATVLMFGAARLSWRAFLWPVAISNLGIALLYATLGAWGQSQGILGWTIVVSIALPLLATGLARWWWQRGVAVERPD